MRGQPVRAPIRPSCEATRASHAVWSPYLRDLLQQRPSGEDHDRPARGCLSDRLGGSSRLGRHPGAASGASTVKHNRPTGLTTDELIGALAMIDCPATADQLKRW